MPTDSEKRVEWPGDVQAASLLTVLGAVIDEGASAGFDEDLERIRDAERGADVLTTTIRIH